MERVGRWLAAVARFGHRHPLRVLLLAGFLAALGGWHATRLQLNTNLSELLPTEFESVANLERLRERFGGIGYVTIAGHGSEAESLRQFAREVAPAIEALPGIQYVEAARPNEFFEDRALFYLDETALSDLHDRLKSRIGAVRMRANPLYVPLDDDPPESVDLKSYFSAGKESGFSRFALSGEPYYLDPNAKLVILMAKPAESSIDLSTAAAVVRSVEKELIENPLLAGCNGSTDGACRYGRNFRIQLTGTYKKKVDQQKQIGKDLRWASSAALLVLLVYLLFHFRSAMAAALVLIPVATALAWTYGVVSLYYDSLNLLTGFLAAVLGGLGVEHGIHLLGRYQNLRTQNVDSEEATARAFAHTGLSALASAVVAALTFFALCISEFRVFKEFGVIAATGMIVVVTGYLLILPALLGLAARRGWRPPADHTVGHTGSWLVQRFLRATFRRRIAVVGGMVVVGVGLFGLRTRFDYDFAALEDASLPSFAFDKKVNQLLGRSQTPAVILTDNEDEERLVATELRRRKAALGKRSTVDFVATLSDLVPEQQQSKRMRIEAIAKTLSSVDRAELSPGDVADFDRLVSLTAAQPFTRNDLPTAVRRQFLGASQSGSGFVLAFPAVSLADGTKVRAFADEVRRVALDGKRHISAAGEAMILADIINLVVSESPRVLLATLVAVLAAMLVALGNIKKALLCFFPSAVSVTALCGVMVLADLRFNYLNIIVITVLLGVTIDAGVHLVERLSDTTESFAAVYLETGRSICGGLLTSAIGFGAMLLADHPGLRSLGQVAILGFAINLIVMLLVAPAWFYTLRKSA
ncbi:MAG: MMPL family transporter [Deltaproteobacteria bacterium]|nr:MMPL family transporter [Deltaproteobacteria bacterium]